MDINFTPQFHQKLTRSDDEVVWVALPRPYTLLALKERFYRDWETEERTRLEQAGDVVLAFAVSH